MTNCLGIFTSERVNEQFCVAHSFQCYISNTGLQRFSEHCCHNGTLCSIHPIIMLCCTANWKSLVLTLMQVLSSWHCTVFHTNSFRMIFLFVLATTSNLKNSLTAKAASILLDSIQHIKDSLRLFVSIDVLQKERQTNWKYVMPRFQGCSHCNIQSCILTFVRRQCQKKV